LLTKELQIFARNEKKNTIPIPNNKTRSSQDLINWLINVKQIKEEAKSTKNKYVDDDDDG